MALSREIGNHRFIELCAEELETHRAKAAGYSGSDNPDTWANFREANAWGLTPLQGCLVRMGDKYRRVQNLMRDPSNDRVGESLKDTLMDLSNYAKIAVCLWEEEVRREEPDESDETDLMIAEVKAHLVESGDTMRVGEKFQRQESDDAN